MVQKLAVEDIKKVKEGLRELKEEWVSSKPGRGRSTTKYIDKDTVVQILEYATHGITEWHFEILEQWKEEVYKNFAEKNQQPQWGFDGYVYHVKGRLIIEGLGSRMQFGKKVAEGGAKNQDSAYQAAASTCLSKCASLFGVGEKLYVKNQIQNEEDVPEVPQQVYNQQGYNQQGYDMSNQQQQAWNNPNQQYQQQQQPMNQGQQWGQQPQQNWNQQEPQQNQQQTQQQAQPMNQNQQQNQGPWTDNNLGQSPQDISWQQTAHEVDQEMAKGTAEFPFNQAPNATGQENNFQVQEQGQVQEQNFQAQPMGAPVINEQPQQTQQPAVEEPKGSDQQQLFMEQVTIYNGHRERLGIQNDDGMIAYLRDYFQNEKADTSFLNMETIKGFNEYMINMQA